MSTARGWLSRGSWTSKPTRGCWWSTGPNAALVPDALADLRQHTHAPIRWIVYSHGHMGYDYGVPAFLADGERRGDAGPAIIAQENVVRRYRRYAETAGCRPASTPCR
ncbi:hypothetical protein [Saccharopolyspora hattusasensis]|uniref:hypothetical protein n=1 Tax=Saccharopolyspora hattusasensis TaxID=1128679 RepID=UPI003D98621A